MPAKVSPQIARELESLSADQSDAVFYNGNVVVRAGPGSGKTRTLVARASYVLETRISRFQGVACITYTNSAAAEIQRRVQTMGRSSRRRLSSGTLHAFCLGSVLRPYAAFTGQAVASILSGSAVTELLQRSFDEVGISESFARDRVGQITAIRRAMACDENLDRFDSREVNAATRYEQMLHETHRIDFEAMTSRTLQLVKTDQRIRDLTAARFPHVIVDEYQDLGGVLHGIVSALRDEAGIEVFAVGDPDQSIFGYAGADPRYLEELCDRPDFHVVDLQVSYRSGRRIIVASEAGLGRPRGRKAHEQSAPGEVRIVDVGRAGLGEHAVEAASAVRATLDAGVAPERVAVVYPSRGLLPTRIAQELLALDIPYQFEQDDRLPTGAVSSFVQGCASRTVISSRVRGATVDDPRALLVRTSAPTLAALYTHLLRLRSDAALPPPRSRLESLRTMQVVVDPTIPIDTATPAETWMDQLVDAMDLERIFASHPEGGSGDALRQVQEIVRARSLSVEDLAAGQEIIGKVVLTTYHSSKGREFQTVVLPGLVDGYFPMNVRLNGTWTLPRGRQLDAVRRQFYVGLSRAEQVAVLITGMTYENRGGSWRSPGRSRLVRDVESALELA